MEFKTQDQLIKQLKNNGEQNAENAERFAAYCFRLKNETVRDKKTLKNPWMKKTTLNNLSSLYFRVSAEGLIFDGKHVTLNEYGISYDYQSYKKKMLITYPESKIDWSLVFDGDKTKFSKINGEVIYNHDFADPMNQKDERVIGGYIVIKNNRGEFLTILDREDIEKHREIAKTDDFWANWFKEMCAKTLIRKACKYHFDDMYTEMDAADNDNFDLEKVSVKKVSKIDKLSDQITDLLETYKGEDKNVIRTMCQEKKAAGDFDEPFAKSIIKQLKPKK